MRMRKIYGQSKHETCYFCDKNAIMENKQGLGVCLNHKDKLLDDRKCVCGEYMEMKKGKFGPFFLCPNCGPQSLKKSEEFSTGGYKLNKKYREGEKKKEKVYSLDELDSMWADK